MASAALLATSLPNAENGHQARNHRRQHLLELLDGRPSPRLLRRIHALMLRRDLLSHPASSARLLSAACATDPDYAHKLFDQIPHSSLHSWNLLLRACASAPSPGPSLALRLLLRLLRETSLVPDKFTYPFAIKAASALANPRFCLALHGLAAKSPFHSDIYVLNTLLHMYSSLGRADAASTLFSRMPEKDLVSWNTMIHALTDAGHCGEAVELFDRMESEGMRPNHFTMMAILAACRKGRNLDLGRRVHCYIDRSAIRKDVILLNALLDMYVKCGSMKDAEELFAIMPERDLFASTTMVAGYAGSGDFIAARRVLDWVMDCGIGPWNALISGFEQGGHPREALAAFHECLARGPDVKPDEITFVSALNACTQLGMLDTGSWIHDCMRKKKVKLNTHLITSLIDMYSKCGDLAKALEVFESVDDRDVFIWSAMITGLAMHGKGSLALELFERMHIDAKVKPNHVTLLNVLCACSHAGLVDEGRLYFNQMLPVFGIEPEVEHYARMVDILGRSGRIQEAMELIEGMKIQRTANVWRALLGACAVHGNVELGELASKCLLEQKPEDDGAYVLLSNLYAKSGRWDEVARVRRRMHDAGVKKQPGLSSIEVQGILHEFVVGDSSHPLSGKIYCKLDEVMAKLKGMGYVPNGAHVLQYSEEDEVKEQALSLHSEKLAIAFGLLTIDSSSPIRIMKNLHICQDCHTVAKLISAAYEREIMIRDRYRFHHFKGGQCSCLDYW